MASSDEYTSASALGRTRLGPIAVDGFERRIQLGERHGSIGPFGIFNRCLHAAQFRIAVQDELDRGLRTGGYLLLDMRDFDSRRQIDVAAIRSELAEDCRKKAGFPRTVGAGNAGLVAAKDNEAGLLKERLRAPPQRKIARGQHRNGLGSKPD